MESAGSPARTGAFTVSVSGAKATLFSLISPKSNTSVGLRFTFACSDCTSTKNSIFSVRERSAPLGLMIVRSDRQRRPDGVFPTRLLSPIFQANRRVPVPGSKSKMPPVLSG